MSVEGGRFYLMKPGDRPDPCEPPLASSVVARKPDARAAQAPFSPSRATPALSA
jgi:hypothetical protein